MGETSVNKFEVGGVLSRYHKYAHCSELSLHANLKEAIANENYEEAVLLRDAIINKIWEPAAGASIIATSLLATFK